MLAAVEKRSRLCAPKPRSNALETVGVPALASPSPATPTDSRLPADVLGKGIPGATALVKGEFEERSGEGRRAEACAPPEGAAGAG